MTTDKARAEAELTITTERAVLIVLAEADELRDTVEIIEQTNEKMGYRSSAVQRMALEETKRRERELRQVAVALTARDAEAEGLREAVRVLAEECYRARVQCNHQGSPCDFGRVGDYRDDTDANPIAKAAIDAAGGA